MEEGVSRQEFKELKELFLQQQQTIVELQGEADFFKRGLTNFIDEQLQQKGAKGMDFQMYKRFMTAQMGTVLSEIKDCFTKNSIPLSVIQSAPQVDTQWKTKIETHIKTVEETLLKEIKSLINTKTDYSVLSEPLRRLQIEMAHIKEEWMLTDQVLKYNEQDRVKELNKTFAELKTSLTNTEEFLEIKASVQSIEQQTKAHILESKRSLDSIRIIEKALTHKFNDTALAAIKESIQKEINQSLDLLKNEQMVEIIQYKEKIEKLYEIKLKETIGSSLLPQLESLIHKILDRLLKEENHQIFSILEGLLERLLERKKRDMYDEIQKTIHEKLDKKIEIVCENSQAIQKQIKLTFNDLTKRIDDTVNFHKEFETNFTNQVNKSILSHSMGLDNRVEEYYTKHQKQTYGEITGFIKTVNKLQEDFKISIRLGLEEKIEENRRKEHYILDENHKKIVFFETIIKQIQKDSRRIFEENTKDSHTILEKQNIFEITIKKEIEDCTRNFRLLENTYKILEKDIKHSIIDSLAKSQKHIDTILLEKVDEYSEVLQRYENDNFQKLQGRLEKLLLQKEEYSITTIKNLEIKLFDELQQRIVNTVQGDIVKYIMNSDFLEILKKYLHLDQYVSRMVINEKLTNEPIPTIDINENLSPEIKKCFFTACIGNSGQTLDNIVPFQKAAGWDYIMFTNREFPATIPWKIHKVEREYDDPALNAKMYKWQAHKFLPEYDVVVWIDSYMSPNPTYIKNLDSLLQLKLYKENKGILHRPHKDRICVWDECDAVVSKRRAKKEDVDKNRRLLKEENMPKNFGLVDTNVVCRLNKDPQVHRVCDEVFKVLQKASSRDQLAVTMVYYKESFNRVSCIEILPYFVKSGTHVRIPAYL